MEGRRVLVAGGAGFIGSSLANHIAAENDVVVVDDCHLGTPANLDDSVSFHRQSVVESDVPTDVDVVFHLAALSSYPMHERDPARGARVNVEGFVNVVEQARVDGCETVVYASTSSVYGDRTRPTPEDIPVVASSGYEASKLARERYAEYFGEHHGMNLAGMRLFSVYEGFGGAEGHKGRYANLVAQFADAIANGASPEIYGDGSQTRDFVHVADVVDALVRAGEASLHGRYNVGTGESHSLLELVDRLNRTLGTDVEPTFVENPMDESVYVHDTCADPSKLLAATGWEPTIDLEEGLRRVCAHYR